jgi:DNA (cytosine-5)-methyltransferase 1
MGFPDQFRFHGTKTEVARQIGNAVPPPLASALARMIVQMLTPLQMSA